MIELAIALFIIAVLAIAGARAFGGAKKATYAGEGKTVGSAYMQVISQYHADHSNQHPPLTGNNSAAVIAGPLDLTNKPYMRSVPDAVTAGRVGVSMGASNCGASGVSAASTQVGWVSICYAAAPRFSVRVANRKDAASPWTYCWMGATTALPKC